MSIIFVLLSLYSIVCVFVGPGWMCLTWHVCVCLFEAPPPVALSQSAQRNPMTSCTGVRIGCYTNINLSYED